MQKTPRPKRILSVDIGGSHLKALLTHIHAAAPARGSFADLLHRARAESAQRTTLQMS